jgi:hypothetical protein
MKPAPTNQDILDSILLGLADEFEAGNGTGRLIEHDTACPEEFEPLRECLADLISEGWLVQRAPFKVYALTPEGYRHFKPRIQALRMFGKL